jgi:hypothetical protein
MDRRSPFFIGMTGAAGVVVTIALVELVIKRARYSCSSGWHCSSPSAWTRW